MKMRKFFSVLLTIALIVLPIAAVVTAAAAVVSATSTMRLLEKEEVPVTEAPAVSEEAPAVSEEAPAVSEEAPAVSEEAPAASEENPPANENTSENTPTSSKATQVTTTAAKQQTSEDPYAPPSNLNKLSKAEQLAYFNKVANRVRKEKPGFEMETLRQIGKLELTGSASALTGLLDMVKNQLMPGEPVTETVAKGSSNVSKFFSDNANASDLKVSDITSISSVKQGENWVITVKIIEETNPAVGTGSANSRINMISSTQEVLDDIVGISSAISADVNKAKLIYHDGVTTITVNSKGQITSANTSFDVTAQANEVQAKVVFTITTDVTAPQSNNLKYWNFKW